MLRSDICKRCATGGILASVAGSLETSDFMSDSSSSSWFKTLCRTAFAGLLPARDSLLRCWCDSARHSTSANRAFRDMAGWLGSWVRLRYAALLNCSSITRACSNSCRGKFYITQRIYWTMMSKMFLLKKIYVV